MGIEGLDLPPKCPQCVHVAFIRYLIIIPMHLFSSQETDVNAKIAKNTSYECFAGDIFKLTVQKCIFLQT